MIETGEVRLEGGIREPCFGYATLDEIPISRRIYVRKRI